MPQKLADLIKSQTQKKTDRASYFYAELTGNGKRVGLLNENTDHIADNFKNHTDDSQKHYEPSFKQDPLKDIILKPELQESNKRNPYKTEKHINTSVLSVVNAISTTNQVSSPINPIALRLKTKTAPAFLKNTLLKTISNQTTFDVKAGLIIDQIAKQKEVKTDRPKSVYTFSPNLVFAVLNKKLKNGPTTTLILNVNDLNGDQADRQLTNALRRLSKHRNLYIIVKNVNLYDSFNMHHALSQTVTALNRQFKLNLNQKTILKAIETLELHEILTSQAKNNNQNIIYDVCELLKAKSPELEFRQQRRNHQNVINAVYPLLKFEEKGLTEKDYNQFYNRLKGFAHRRPNLYPRNLDFDKLVNVNTRLALAHQLVNLKANPNTYQFKPKTQDFKTDKQYSSEQLAVIKTTEPFAIGVAGAGSGKSHTLLGRLNYLKQNEIDLNRVLVTTFTNVSAQDIINRFDNEINSLTNANLFHQIYLQNFDHDLTSESTLCNLLNVISPTSKLSKSTITMNDTRTRLSKILKDADTSTNSYKQVDSREITQRLIKLVNERTSDVVKLLNAIKQTTLILEPVIINALMQNQQAVKFPNALSNLDFIITDEAQDTSSFEYVLLLQLAQMNNAQMLIMGDANQTLYEFRNANPDFLNTLERSDVFKTYTMMTNYRSNQNILTFANQFLDVLKTNQTANINLKSNQYENITKDSFKKDVELLNHEAEKRVKGEGLTKEAMLQDYLEKNHKFQEWVIDHVVNHKQIAIMTFRNKDAQAIANAVTQIAVLQTGKEPKITYTRKPTKRPNTWLSEMLSNLNESKINDLYKNNQPISVEFAKNWLISELETQFEIASHRSKDGKQIENDFARKTANQLADSRPFAIQIKELNSHKYSVKRFIGFLNMELAKAETKRNNLSRLLENTQSTNWQDADVVVSTIHSAKGLEFESVICHFDESQKSATSQENLRLYGVALTRAKQDELIINVAKRKSINRSSSIDLSESGMFKTPMQTAYGRIINELTPKQPTTK